MQTNATRYTFKSAADLQRAAAELRKTAPDAKLEINLETKSITTAATEFSKIARGYRADAFALTVDKKSAGQPKLESRPFKEAAPPKASGLFGTSEPRPSVPVQKPIENLVHAPGVLEAGPVANTTVKNFSEYGRAEGLIIAWKGVTPGAAPSKETVLPLIRETAKDDLAYVVVPPGHQAEIAAEMKAAGVNMDNVRYIEADLDTVWMRDYGPVFVHTMDGELQVVDMVYNRPWPKDDAFPLKFAEQTGMPIRKTDLIFPGGNLILAGKTAFMTDVVMDPSQGKPGDHDYYVPALESYTPEKVAALAKEAFGVDKIVMVRDMNDDGTGHIDMFVDKLDDRTFMVGEYAPGDDAGNGNREILDEAAARIASEKNDAGENYRVIRLPMPPKVKGGPTLTYANATPLNNKIFVPQFGIATDAAAIEAYRKALPGHEVIPMDCREIIKDDGAIHCITQVVMRAPVGVAHTPDATLGAGHPNRLDFEFDTEKPLKGGASKMYWSTSPDGPFTGVELKASSGNEHQGKLSADLPAQPAGTQLYYFAHLEDEEGRSRTWPDKALRDGTAYRADVS